MTREEYKAMSRNERAAANAKLPAKKQKVWELHAQGYSFSQIARAMELPDTPTAWRYFKAYHKELNKETQDQMRDSLLAELRRIQSSNDDDKVKLQAIDRIMKLFDLGNTSDVTIKAEGPLFTVVGIDPKKI